MKREAFLAGLLAGGAALLVLLAGRAVTGTPGFLEAVADGVVGYVPLEVFETLLGLLGPYAKGLTFAGVAAGTLIAGGLAGVALRRTLPRSRPGGAGLLGRLPDVLLVVGVAWLLAEVVVFPLAGAGLFGAARRVDPVALHGPLLGAALVYGAFLVGLLAGTEAAQPSEAAQPGETAESVRIGRRTLLGRAFTLAGLGALVLASGSVVLEVLSAARKPLGGGATGDETPTGFGPTPSLTPPDDFYVVGKNVLPVAVDAASWRLRLDGLVERPLAWTLDELRAKPRHEAFRTLECISYQVVPGDDLIGNQRFAGVRLADLLDEAGVLPDARFLHFESADGYTESLPLEVGRHADTWVADEMGPAGTPLTADHGFPARLLIAGRFGMKQPKWLTRITLAADDLRGYWEQRGWDEQAIVRTMSRIDRPEPGAEVVAGAPLPVYGIANSGDRGIGRVEVSADDGATWTDAELETIEAPLGPLTWVRWRAEVTVPASGPAILVARATDGTGETQDGTPRSPLPSGATGWHRVRVVPIPAPTRR